MGRSQTFVSCQRRKDFYWSVPNANNMIFLLDLLVSGSIQTQIDNNVKVNAVADCWLRWSAKGWVTLMELPMPLAGGVGMCHRYRVFFFHWASPKKGKVWKT